MSRKQSYNDEIGFIKGDCDFRAYHEYGETGSAYLLIDYEEHPYIDEKDLEPLGKLLIKTVEKYVSDNKDADFEIEKHSSSYHVLYKGNTIAKVWHSEIHNSQIKNEGDARRVAEKLVRYMSDKEDYMRMPKLNRTCDEMPYKVEKGCSTLASFKKGEDADRYMDEFVYTKYGQKIKHTYGVDKLMNSKGTGDTISLYHGYGVFSNKLAKDILYDLREYIHEKIEEAE